MNMSFVLLIIGLASATLCDAHAHLKDSQPADGSVVTIAPDNLVLRFSEAARVTALALHRVGEAERKLVPLPTAPAQQVTLPLSKLGPGKYVVTRSEEHTSELQSQSNLVCRLLLEKKKKKTRNTDD